MSHSVLNNATLRKIHRELYNTEVPQSFLTELISSMEYTALRRYMIVYPELILICLGGQFSYTGYKATDEILAESASAFAPVFYMDYEATNTNISSFILEKLQAIMNKLRSSSNKVKVMEFLLSALVNADLKVFNISRYFNSSSVFHELHKLLSRYLDGDYLYNYLIGKYSILSGQRCVDRICKGEIPLYPDSYGYLSYATNTILAEKGTDIRMDVRSSFVSWLLSNPIHLYHSNSKSIRSLLVREAVITRNYTAIMCVLNFDEVRSIVREEKLTPTGILACWLEDMDGAYPEMLALRLLRSYNDLQQPRILDVISGLLLVTPCSKDDGLTIKLVYEYCAYLKTLQNV